jgi:cytochrome c-type biogenesis protein CcmF
MFYSEYSEGVMKNPDIANLVVKDLYLSPMALEVPEQFGANDVDSLKKGETKQMKGLKIKFLDFNMSEFNRDEISSGKSQTIGADLEVTSGDKTSKMTVKIKYAADGNPEFIVTPVNDNTDLFLAKINVEDEPNIQIAVVNKDEAVHDPGKISSETLVLTASIKPYINLVWGGTVVIVIGFIFSIIGRYKRLKSKARDDENEEISENGEMRNGAEEKDMLKKKKDKTKEKVS